MDFNAGFLKINTFSDAIFFILKFRVLYSHHFQSIYMRYKYIYKFKVYLKITTTLKMFLKWKFNQFYGKVTVNFLFFFL